MKNVLSVKVRALTDEITSYCLGVSVGDIPACEIHRAACQRQLDDLERWAANDNEFPYHWDALAAYKAVNFVQLMPHIKGEWAARKELLKLQPWQKFIVGVPFGWLRNDDKTRRYRTVFILVPRKNGKSLLTSAISLYAGFVEGEEGAETYSAATTRDQAKIVFNDAAKMVKKSAKFRKKFGVKALKTAITQEKTGSNFTPLSSDAHTLDGLNVHFAAVDEVHAHKTRDVWDVLDTGTGSRSQPMLWGISTAGFNKQGICYEQVEYLKAILLGGHEDETYFGTIFTIDEDDDPFDLLTWAKANPNLNVSLKLSQLERLAKKARVMPQALNNFMTKHLNVWMDSASLWMNSEAWKGCGEEFDPETLAGQECYGGLDLASTKDITALSLVFPCEDGVKVITRYYLPEDRVQERVEKNKVQYDVWARDGLLTLTPGNVTDYNFIKRDIGELAEKYDIREIAYDRWNSSQLVNDLVDDGAKMVPMGQGFASMSPPLKELERLVLSGGLNHGGDPVLTWMAGNLVVKEDEAGNLKPAKNKSPEKIDGMVALLMALDRMTRHDDKPTLSVYELLALEDKNDEE